MDIDPYILKKFLSLDSKSGFLYWKDRCPEDFMKAGDRAKKSCSAWNGRYAGTRAGSIQGENKYRSIHISRFGTVKEHRAIFAMVHGFYPEEVDHINHVRTDNRPVNLRESTRQQNVSNTRSTASGTSKYRGVHKGKGKRPWRVSVVKNKIHVFRSQFATEREAALAYNREAKIAFGDFAILNDVD